MRNCQSCLALLQQRTMGANSLKNTSLSHFYASPLWHQSDLSLYFQHIGHVLLSGFGMTVAQNGLQVLLKCFNLIFLK